MLTHPLGQRYLVFGHQRDFLQGRHATRRNVHKLRARRLQAQGQLGRLFDGPAAIDPVGARDAHAQGATKHLAHGAEHLHWHADAVVKRAAVSVLTLVADR